MPKRIHYTPGGPVTMDDRTTAEAIAESLDAIDIEYANRINAGMLHNGVLYQIDERSTQRMNDVVAYVNNGGALIPGFAWIPYNNVPVPMGVAEVKALALAAGDYVMKIRAAYQLAKRNARAARNNAEADSIKVTWPT